MSSLNLWRRASVVVLLSVSFATRAAYGHSQVAADAWVRLQKAEIGQTITVALTGSTPAKVQLWFIDDSTLVTSPPVAEPKVPRDVRRVLAGMGPGWKNVLGGGVFIKGSVRIAPDGVFKGTKKVADLTQAAQIVSRERVSTLEFRPSHTIRNSLLALAIIIGVWLIGVLVYVIAVYF